MSTTTRWAIPYPELTNAADVPQWMHDLAVSLDDHAKDDQGVLSARPISTPAAPGKRGRYYMVIGDSTPANNGILWRDNGTGWDQVGIALVDNSHLGNDAVDSRVLAPDSVTDVEIAADSVGASEIKPNTITATELIDGLVPSRGPVTGGTESLRALGTTAGTAASGTDSRFPRSAASISALNAAFGGTPPDGARGQIVVGSGVTTTTVQLSYCGLLSKWLSAEWGAGLPQFDNINSTGSTYIGGQGNKADWSPYIILGADLLFAAGLYLQVRGSVRADNSGGSGRGNVSVGLQTVAAVGALAGDPAWTNFLAGPIILTITANNQTVFGDFDWKDLNSSTLSGLSLLKYARPSFGVNHTVSSVRTLVPVLIARWAG